MDLFQLLQPNSLPIDIVMIVLVLLSGLFQQKYLSGVQKLNGAWKTLIVSFVFCIIYGSLFFLAYGIEKNMLLRWFFSYVLATSMYELLIKKFTDKFFPEEKNTTTTETPKP
jgi:hypothetical protein